MATDPTVGTGRLCPFMFRNMGSFGLAAAIVGCALLAVSCLPAISPEQAYAFGKVAIVCLSAAGGSAVIAGGFYAAETINQRRRPR